MSVIQNNLLLAGDDAYNIQRSLRFRASANAYLSRIPSTGSGNQKATFSFWMKRGRLGQTYPAIYGTYLTSSGGGDAIVLQSDTLRFWMQGGGQASIVTTQLFRDTSAWYHIVLAIDTTQATASNRIKLYVNGSQVTSFSSATYPTQNLTFFEMFNASTYQYIGLGYTEYFDGYLAEFNAIDGQALTPSSFGENNAQTGVWQPKRYTGTYGTNGFYLPFTNNSTTTTLGNDFSGNGNNWTTNNISLTAGATYDSMTDVPTLTSATTANYSVMNPLDEGATGSTISNGNLTVATASTGFRYMGNTMWVSSGKFYAEFTLTATSGFAQLGIATTTTGTNKILGNDSTSWAYESWSGQIRNSNSATNYGATWTTNDVIGICLDKDNNRLYFSKNGVWQNSADPAAGTGSVNISGISGVATMIAVCDNDNGGSVTFQANFGQRPFAYTPPTGFVALNTFNLPTPTIGATASTQANKYFDISLYSGNNSTQTVTNSGSMQPDMVWIKSRNVGGSNHVVTDSVRGVNRFVIPNLTDSEYNIANTLTSFNSNGFSLGNTAYDFNISGNNYVGWQWRAANGNNVTNTAGSITSTVSANTTSGFSVVRWIGNGSVATIGHGLGVAPAMVITKNLTQGAAGYNWAVYHRSLPSASSFVDLNTTAAAATNTGIWNGTAPTSTVFSVGTARINNGDANIAYCFAEVAGFSRFGSYTGNGSTDGPFVFTGFRPRYVMIKRTDTAGDSWIIWDTARSPFNITSVALAADSSSAEFGYSVLDIVSNGLKVRGTSGNTAVNATGSTYIYMAFAENPFKYSLAR